MIVRILGMVLLVSALDTNGAIPDVLVVVPPGAELATVQKIRSAVSGRRLAVVAEGDRVAVKGGFEMLVDRSFASAPAASVLVLVPGDAGRAEEAFLLDRRRSAKAILLPAGSPLAERLRGDGSGGALILLGSPESIPGMIDAVDGVSGTATAMPAPAPAAPVSAPPPEPTRVRPAATPAVPPAATPTPAVSARVFERYFSSRPPTPTRTPR